MTDRFFSASDFRQTDTCSDCIERDDVDLLGRVRRGREGRVDACAGCRNGRVRRGKVEIVSWWVANRERVS